MHAHAHMHPGDYLAGPTALTDGWYWYDGDASSLLPVVGAGYLAWDGTTDKQATGDSVSVLKVGSIEPSQWTTTQSWDGSMTAAYKKGNASAMATMTPDSGTNPNHIVYTSGDVVGNFTSQGTNTAHLAVYTQGTAGVGILLEASSLV